MVINFKFSMGQYLLHKTKFSVGGSNCPQLWLNQLHNNNIGCWWLGDGVGPTHYVVTFRRFYNFFAFCIQSTTKI